MRHAPLLTLLGIAIGGASPAAQALGIGRTTNTSTLGQPLNLMVAVQIDGDEQLTSRCISATVLAGDAAVRSDRVRVSLEPGTDARQRLVRIATTSPIAEPLVTVNLTVGCQSRVTRNFVTLINPPTAVKSEPLELEQPPVRAVESRVATLPASGESRIDVPRLGLNPRGRWVRQSSPSNSSATPMVAAVATPSRPARAAATLKIASRTDAKVIASPDTSSAQAEHVRELEAGLASLRNDAALGQQSVAALQARLHEVEDSRASNPIIYVLGGLAALVVAAVVAIWKLWPRRRARVPAVAARPSKRSTRKADAVRSEIPVLRDRAELGQKDSAALERLIEPAREPIETPRPALLDDTSLGGLEVTQVLDPTMHARVKRSSRADGTFSSSTFGRLEEADTRGAGPSMEVLVDVEQQAEFYLMLGQDEAAIALLDKHIAEGGGSPMPFLKLLEIHQRRRDEAAYNGVRQHFNERFKAHAPEWTSSLELGRTLDGYPATLESVQNAWAAPMQAMKMLDGLLFRRSANEDAFDFAAYRDLLFLYSIARDLSGDIKPAMGADVDLVLPLDEESIALLSRRMKVALPTVSANASRIGDVDVDIVAAPTQRHPVSIGSAVAKTGTF